MPHQCSAIDSEQHFCAFCHVCCNAWGISTACQEQVWQVGPVTGDIVTWRVAVITQKWPQTKPLIREQTELDLAWNQNEWKKRSLHTEIIYRYYKNLLMSYMYPRWKMLTVSSRATHSATRRILYNAYKSLFHFTSAWPRLDGCVDSSPFKTSWDLSLWYLCNCNPKVLLLWFYFRPKTTYKACKMFPI